MVMKHSTLSEVTSITMGVVSYGMTPRPSTGHEIDRPTHHIAIQLSTV